MVIVSEDIGEDEVEIIDIDIPTWKLHSSLSKVWLVHSSTDIGHMVNLNEPNQIDR